MQRFNINVKTQKSTETHNQHQQVTVYEYSSASQVITSLCSNICGPAGKLLMGFLCVPLKINIVCIANIHVHAYVRSIKCI